MVTSRSSFAGERPIHEKLEEQLGLQSRLINEMGRNAAQAQAAEYQIALPALPPSVGSTDSFAKGFAGAASNIVGAISQRVANNNSNNNNNNNRSQPQPQQPQQPQQQATSMWSSYGWPSIANSYNRYG